MKTNQRIQNEQAAWEMGEYVAMRLGEKTWDADETRRLEARMSVAMAHTTMGTELGDIIGDAEHVIVDMYDMTAKLAILLNGAGPIGRKYKEDALDAYDRLYEIVDDWWSEWTSEGV